MTDLADLWRSLPPIGEWVDEAACADLGPGADVFTADHPDAEELVLAVGDHEIPQLEG
jgi:hypothetical protein